MSALPNLFFLTAADFFLGRDTAYDRLRLQRRLEHHGTLCVCAFVVLQSALSLRSRPLFLRTRAILVRVFFHNFLSIDQSMQNGTLAEVCEVDLWLCFFIYGWRAGALGKRDPPIFRHKLARNAKSPVDQKIPEVISHAECMTAAQQAQHDAKDSGDEFPRISLFDSAFSQ